MMIASRKLMKRFRNSARIKKFFRKSAGIMKSGFRNGVPKIAHCKIFGPPNYSDFISTIHMYKFIKIRHNDFLPCHENDMEMKKNPIICLRLTF